MIIPIYKCGLKFVKISTGGLKKIIKHHENVTYKVINNISDQDLWTKYININFSSSLDVINKAPNISDLLIMKKS